MNDDLISKRSAHERLIIAKTLLETVLQDMPTAEPEIIRCKDCIFHNYKDGIPYCENIDYGYGWKDDDFCSYAERRKRHG